jgi:hypothetical protein
MGVANPPSKQNEKKVSYYKTHEFDFYTKKAIFSRPQSVI